MRGHNLCCYAEIWKIIPELSLLPLFIWSTELTQVEKGGSTEISVLQIRRANRDNFGIH